MADDPAPRPRYPYTWDGSDPEPSVSPFGELGRSFTLGFVSLWAKLVLGVANSLNVADDGHERFVRAVTERAAGQGLLTISNHRSTLDDPVLFCALLPARFFLTEHVHHQTRWVLCAHDICHKNQLLSNFFLAGKTLPVERGGGLGQPVMGLVSRLLAGGDWVHVFPEGRVRQDGELNAFKLGTAYLLCKARERDPAAPQPVVLPFFHEGMERVKPMKQMVEAGHDVRLRVGEPVALDDLLKRCGKKGQDQMKLYKEITDRLDKALRGLETEERKATRLLQQRQQPAATGGPAGIGVGGGVKS